MWGYLEGKLNPYAKVDKESNSQWDKFGAILRIQVTRWSYFGQRDNSSGGEEESDSGWTLRWNLRELDECVSVKQSQWWLRVFGLVIGRKKLPFTEMKAMKQSYTWGILSFKYLETPKKRCWAVKLDTEGWNSREKFEAGNTNLGTVNIYMVCKKATRLDDSTKGEWV